MKGIKPFIKLTPFLMLGICFFLSFMTKYEWYITAYYYLSQIIGFSIITNIYFLYFIQRSNMCAYSTVSTIGLLSLNVLDIINLIWPLTDFYQYYSIGISGFFFILTIIYFIKWNLKQNK